jgi:hypothetical protein
MAKNWAAEIEEMMAKNPQVVNTPSFKQMFMGEWAIDTDSLVLHYNGNNIVEELPSDVWTYALGVDLGFNDATAFVVVAFNSYRRELYVTRTEKYKEIDITDTANVIKRLQLRYGCEFTIIDASNLQAVEEMRRRHGLSIMPAEKSNKGEFLCLLDDEIRQGYVKVLRVAEELITEGNKVVWDDSKTKLSVAEGCDDHLTHAFLYVWRYCYQYNTKPRVDLKIVSASDRFEQYLEKKGQEILNKQKQKEWWQ